MVKPAQPDEIIRLIQDAGEPAAIPDLLPFLIVGDRRSILATAKAIHHLLRKLKPADFARFDEFVGYGMSNSVIEGNTIAIDEPQPPYGLSYTSPGPPLFATPFISAANGSVHVQPFPLTFPPLNASAAHPNPYLIALRQSDVITRPASRRPEYTVSALTLTALGPKEAEMSSRHPVGVVI